MQSVERRRQDPLLQARRANLMAITFGKALRRGALRSGGLERGDGIAIDNDTVALRVPAMKTRE
jgi:hypothetical protein